MPCHPWSWKRLKPGHLHEHPPSIACRVQPSLTSSPHAGPSQRMTARMLSLLWRRPASAIPRASCQPTVLQWEGTPARGRPSSWRSGRGASHATLSSLEAEHELSPPTRHGDLYWPFRARCALAGAPGDQFSLVGWRAGSRWVLVGWGLSLVPQGAAKPAVARCPIWVSGQAIRFGEPLLGFESQSCSLLYQVNPMNDMPS